MAQLLRKFLPPYGWRTLLGVATKAIEVLFDLLTPLIVARMVDEGVAARDVGLTVRLGLLLMGLAVLGYLFTLVCQHHASIVSQGMGTDIRDALFAKANELSGADLDGLGTSSLVTRILSDVNQVQVTVALGIRQLVRWPFLAVGSMVAALLIDRRLGAVLLVCTPAIGAVFWLVMSRSVPLFTAIQRWLDAVSRITREGLSGVRVVRAFRREGAEEGRFREAAGAYSDSSVRVGRLSAILSPATFLIMNLGVIAILWAGGARVEAGELTQGEVVAFVTYMTQTLLSISYVANLVVIFTRGAASAGRIMAVIGLVPKVSDAAARELRPRLEAGTVALKVEGVSFSYADGAADALHDVSLTLPVGGRLGIIGGTGSGKSTLANLLVRLYDPDEGTIDLFGHPQAHYPLAQLRHLVAIVPQQASLLSGTIRSNLSWRDAAATDDELWEALEVAQAADFVRAKEGGLDEVVEAGGRNFSGGQRQRLTIARALVGHPSMLVLDDCASALDMATDAALRAALSSLKGTCVVTISQRISSLRASEQICVLDHGSVAGIGTHDELLRTCGLYREIALSQLSREEVSA